MAKIGGITIKIGADTSELNRSLKQTDKEIKNTQKSLADVEKKLKLDPANVDLLEQKAKLLSKAVKDASDKLEALKKAESELKEQGVDENSAQFLALEREIQATEKALQQAKQESESYNVSLEKIKGTLNNVSSAAQTVADKTKALSVAGAAVVTALGGMAIKAMTASDDLNTLAQQSGLTTAEIQKFQYASAIVDVSSETIISSLRKLTKNMDSTSTETQAAWEKIGVATRDSSGALRDTTDVFYETWQALSRIPNETERDVIAMQLFGKSANDLAGIIDDGGAKLRMLGDEAERNGKIWSQEAIDAANATNDLVDALKADVSQTILVTGGKVLEELAPLIESVIGAIGGLLDWLGQLDSVSLGIILTIATLVASISPIAGLIANITLAVGGLITVWPKLQAVLTTANLKIVAIMAVLLVLAGLISSVANAWGDMSGWEKAIAVIGTLTSVALAAAIAMGAFTSATTMGLAAAGIVAGVAATIAAVESAKRRAQQEANTKNIPMMANGGVLSNGSAIVGEAGAELLTVSNGRATVQPLTNTTNNTYNQLSTSPIEVIMQIDGMTAARQLINPMEYLNNLKGGSSVR